MYLRHSDGPREVLYRESMGPIIGCYKDKTPFSRNPQAYNSRKFAFYLAFVFIYDVVIKKICKNDVEHTDMSY